MKSIGLDVDECLKLLQNHSAELDELMSMVERPHTLSEDKVAVARQHLRELKARLRQDSASTGHRARLFRADPGGSRFLLQRAVPRTGAECCRFPGSTRIGPGRYPSVSELPETASEFRCESIVGRPAMVQDAFTERRGHLDLAITGGIQ